MKLNLALLWTILTGTLATSLWIFNNIAWAEDVDRIEARLIKRDLRDLRKDLEEESDPDDRKDLERDIEELLDDLCQIEPEYREC